MSDFPDDFGMQMFPSYGPFTTASGQTQAVSGDWKTIFTLTGKGQIYGGVLSFGTPGLSLISKLRIVVDGATAFSYTLSALGALPLTSPPATPIYMLCYDTAGESYKAALAPGITFVTSYAVQFYEVSATLPLINYDVWHTSIT